MSNKEDNNDLKIDKDGNLEISSILSINIHDIIRDLTKNLEEIYSKTSINTISRNDLDSLFDNVAHQDLQGKSKCFHKWKHYNGFTEKYEYCIVCDEKRV